MSAETDENKLKLVRVVLFLPWTSRDGWNSYLVNAAKRTHADYTSTSPKFSLTDEDEKTGEKRRYTGQFSQYSLLSDPDKKLFGKFETWRFLEILEAKGMGKVLCDSYVYFCEDMKRDGSKLLIEELRPSKYDSGFDCGYKKMSQDSNQERSPGFLLPLPQGLECYAKNATLRGGTLRQFARCPHGPDFLTMNGWGVSLNVSNHEIENGFRDGDSFSTNKFLKEDI